ncbi:MAG: YqjK-like family protein [Zoogloeaceae bacterium]|jgi:hypothetical protein|nr:YqjK-like family protein [Zoogloeaceae bacterium]
MNSRLLELREQRGLLRARCESQREAFANTHGAVFARVCDVADKAQAGARWLKRHPSVVGVAAALLVIRKPIRLWRWGRRAYMAWRGWRALRRRLPI